MARQLDLDLVEVAPLANPPVCRIMDYGKFRYEESQKAKESRKKTVHVSIKEVKLRPKIGKGDLDTKVRHMQEFLTEGHKVKVTLQFRGREMAHPELGSRLLDTVLEQLDGLGKIETQARLEGRNMTMVLAPEKRPTPKRERPHHEPRPAATPTATPSDAPQATEPTAPAEAGAAAETTPTGTPEATPRAEPETPADAAPAAVAPSDVVDADT